MTGRRQGIWKAPPRLRCDLAHLYGILSPDPRETIHLVQILGSLGGGGRVAFKSGDQDCSTDAPTTSCLILNKSLCLCRLIFLICQVTWRLWNRRSLKILPALQFYSGSVCTCRQWCGGRKGTGEGSKLNQENKTLLPGAALGPHVLCSTGLSQIIQIIDWVLSFLCQWTHSFSVSGSSSCFSEISIPGLPSSTESSQKPVMVFLDGCPQNFNPVTRKKKVLCITKKAKPGYRLTVSLLNLVISRAWKIEGHWSMAPLVLPTPSHA